MITFKKWLISEQEEDRESKKIRLKSLMDQAKILADKGGLTYEESITFRKLMGEISSLKYDLVKEPKIEDIIPANQRDSTLSPNVVFTARQDLRKNKYVFLAIEDAAAGSGFNAETAVDDIVRGRNPNVDFRQFYDTFARTRDALRREFGPAIKLYRAEGLQRTKPTQNWATTESYAKQFGSRVISKDIPIENILAVNVGLRGNYHELIVGLPPSVR